MTFRKDSLMFYEHLIALGLTAVICLVCAPIEQLRVLRYFAVLFILLAALCPLLHNERITIDENGISCHKSKKQIWTYKWDDIAFLQPSRYCRMPSIDIMVDTGGKNGYEWSGNYFQLGKAAKKALKLYCKPEKMNSGVK